MKSQFRKLAALCAVMLIAYGANAQNTAVRDSDYVITMQGDTVHCTITYHAIGKNTYTTLADITVVKKILPTEIREFYIHSRKEYYRSILKPQAPTAKNGDGPRKFMEALEIGKLNLYQDFKGNTMFLPMGAFSSVKTIWYVSKGIDEITEIKKDRMELGKSRKNRKDFFEELIKDNKDVYDAYLVEKKFSFDHIRSIIHLYNTGEWIQNWPKLYEFDINKN